MNKEARVLLAEILEDLVLRDDGVAVAMMLLKIFKMGVVCDADGMYEAFNNIHTNLNVEQLTQLQERMADLKKILTTEGGSL